MLIAVKTEVLSQLAERLPPDMRTIQLALEASGSEQRMELLKEAMAADSSGRLDPGSLALTVARMIQDFEGADQELDQEEAGVAAPGDIPDRQLLAKLCLLREELRQLADEAGMVPNADAGNISTSSTGEELQVDVENPDGSSIRIFNINL